MSRERESKSTTLLPDHACLNCGYVMDAATAVGRAATPSAGDISLCIKCGHLAIFTDDLKLREPTGEEFIRIAGDQRIVAATTAIDLLKKERESK